MNEHENNQPIVILKDIVKEFKIGSFKKKIIHAVNGIDLEIGRKEVLSLVGESGSGKTTVASLISKLYNLTSGSIVLDGKEVSGKMNRKDLLEYRKKVQMIFQDPYSSLNALNPVRYAVERPLKVHKLARTKGELNKRVNELFEECGLTPSSKFLDRFPYELSGGQRQRVGIARALAVNPELILADEPTSMLDVSIRLDIMNQMLDLKERKNISYLFITHDLAGAHYMADRIAIMYAGFIVEVGPSDDVINTPRHPYTQLLRKAAPKPESGLEPENIDIGGEVPDLTVLPEGCPFSSRCPVSKEEYLR